MAVEYAVISLSRGAGIPTQLSEEPSRSLDAAPAETSLVLNGLAHIRIPGYILITLNPACDHLGSCEKELPALPIPPLQIQAESWREDSSRMGRTQKPLSSKTKVDSAAHIYPERSPEPRLRHCRSPPCSHRPPPGLLFGPGATPACWPYGGGSAWLILEKVSPILAPQAENHRAMMA